MRDTCFQTFSGVFDPSMRSKIWKFVPQHVAWAVGEVHMRSALEGDGERVGFADVAEAKRPHQRGGPPSPWPLHSGECVAMEVSLNHLDDALAKGRSRVSWGGPC